MVRDASFFLWLVTPTAADGVAGHCDKEISEATSTIGRVTNVFRAIKKCTLIFFQKTLICLKVNRSAHIERSC